MLALFLLLALLLVLVGHAFRLLRWEQFIRIYERPPRGQMLRGMAGGYALNFVLPFHLGDAFRAVYTGRRMKSGIGFALATVIMDRFLDVWFVAFGFIAFRLLGLGGAPVDGAARYYLVFSLLLVLAFALTGCSMVEVDREMDDAEVIIKVNDTQLLKKDVMQYYDNYKATLQYQYQMYSAFGYQVTMPSDDEIKQIVVDALVLQEVRKQKAAELGLPHAPKQFIQYLTEDDRPQVKKDVDYEGGMGVSIGRLREDSIFDWKFVGLAHNTLRGAAGGALECAEMLKALGYITKK